MGITFSGDSGILQLFLSDNVLASYEDDLGGLVSLWLLVTLSGTSAAGPGCGPERIFCIFTFKVCQHKVGLTLPSFRSN